MSREHDQDQDPHDWEEVSVERWAERRGGKDSTVRYECNQCEAVRWRAEEREPTLDTFEQVVDSVAEMQGADRVGPDRLRMDDGSIRELDRES